MRSSICSAILWVGLLLSAADIVSLSWVPCKHHMGIDLISPKKFRQPAPIISVLLDGTDLDPLNNTFLKGLDVFLFRVAHEKV